MVVIILFCQMALALCLDNEAHVPISFETKQLSLSVHSSGGREKTFTASTDTYRHNRAVWPFLWTSNASIIIWLQGFKIADTS